MEILVKNWSKTKTLSTINIFLGKIIRFSSKIKMWSKSKFWLKIEIQKITKIFFYFV